MVVAFHISGGWISAETGGFLYGRRRGKKDGKRRKIFFYMKKEEGKKNNPTTHWSIKSVPGC